MNKITTRLCLRRCFVAVFVFGGVDDDDDDFRVETSRTPAKVQLPCLRVKFSNWQNAKLKTGTSDSNPVGMALVLLSDLC